MITVAANANSLAGAGGTVRGLVGGFLSRCGARRPASDLWPAVSAPFLAAPLIAIVLCRGPDGMLDEDATHLHLTVLNEEARLIRVAECAHLRARYKTERMSGTDKRTLIRSANPSSIVAVVPRRSAPSFRDAPAVVLVLS